MEAPKSSGAAIYRPKGPAAEYAKYACNFYVGCSNGCAYCYLRKGVWAKTLGGDKPALKKRLGGEAQALAIFEKELKQNLPELQKHGLFFTFTSDPFLPSAAPLTISAIAQCVSSEVPVKVLTKRADWDIAWNRYCPCMETDVKRLVAFGFTLTGRDELEPNASPNAERIEAMRLLHRTGFKTWASVEPIADFGSSFKMVRDSCSFCDLFKIGLMAGKKYDKHLLNVFIKDVIEYTYYFGCRLYFKDSLLKAAGIRREDLPGCCEK